jgi:hypothetical protein
VDADCTTGGTCELFTTSKIFLSERPDVKDKRQSLMTPIMGSVHYGGELHNPTPAPGCAFDKSLCTASGVPNACCTDAGTGNCCPDLATGTACPL